MDDGGVERALNPAYGMGPTKSRSGIRMAKREEHLLSVLDQPGVADTDHHHRRQCRFSGIAGSGGTAPNLTTVPSSSGQRGRSRD